MTDPLTNAIPPHSDAELLARAAAGTCANAPWFVMIGDNALRGRKPEEYAKAILALPLEADHAALLAEAKKLPEIAAMIETWEPIDSAPHDGSLFIARNADHPDWGAYPMMRRVRHCWSDDANGFVVQDLGAWLQVRGNEPNYEDGGDSGEGVPFSIAADEYNKSVRYEWKPLAAAKGDAP